MSTADERKRQDEKFMREAYDSGAMENPSYPLVGEWFHTRHDVYLVQIEYLRGMRLLDLVPIQT